MLLMFLVQNTSASSSTFLVTSDLCVRPELELDPVGLPFDVNCECFSNMEQTNKVSNFTSKLARVKIALLLFQ